MAVYENFESILDFRFTINQETDRGCVLMIADFIDNELEKTLIKRLVGSKKYKKENLFNANGPLGTFSSKVNLSYSIGVINKSVYNEINIIRKIRNKFAHNYNLIDFETSEISELIANLKFNFSDKTNRRVFESSAFAILAFIHAESLGDQFVEKKDYIPSKEDKENINSIKEKFIKDLLKDRKQ